MEETPKMKFKEMYPNGMNQTIMRFSKAFYEIMSTDEIDKVIKGSERWEKGNLKMLKKAFDRDHEWYEYHWLILTHEIKSPTLYADILSYMVAMDKTDTYKGEENE